MINEERLMRLGSLLGLSRADGESLEAFTMRVSIAVHKDPMVMTLADMTTMAEVVAGRRSRAAARVWPTEHRVSVDVRVPWWKRVTAHQRRKLEAAVASELTNRCPVTMKVTPVRVRRRLGSVGVGSTMTAN